MSKVPGFTTPEQRVRLSEVRTIVAKTLSNNPFDKKLPHFTNRVVGGNRVKFLTILPTKKVQTKVSEALESAGYPEVIVTAEECRDIQAQITNRLLILFVPALQ